MLQDVHPCHVVLQLPNGATAEISHIGNLVLNSSLKLSNVLCVPSFAYNLLSISNMLQDTNYQVTFLAEKCYLQDHSKTKFLELGSEENGSYMFTQPSQFSTLVNSSKSILVSDSTIDSCDTFLAQVHNSDV